MVALYEKHLMKTILIPVHMILRNPQPQPRFGDFIEVSGWAECALSPAPSVSKEGVDIRLTLALELRSSGGSSGVGKISASSSDRLTLPAGDAALLEKMFAVAGELKGLALNVVFRVSENQVDITHVQCVVGGDQVVE
jgi:hypothetical protein